jgi:hypothetical protein
LLARYFHRGRTDREGSAPLGKGRTAVSGALGAGRSGRTARAGACPDCDFARRARATSRADQASGRACERSHAHQRLCGAGNRGSCGERTSADQSS